ncbi:DUF960 domain-containing protein [Lacticaseibacillus nasuensis]|uniref:DUF960 domain-containing protein n=1 Tax=Lacticaseibacillus nasuensis TaxID=944671 RepID=UPI002245BA34|nr:DUF960 domain-containing protein [Lacticaseibacillus nasuensis]MCX2455679.1 DUF960 domain-containing protein [Lacticaseibacillus nasuensis]
MFDRDSNRFATFGIISQLPGEIIDSIWLIIDQNLQGVMPLTNLLRFELLNQDGKLTVRFDAEDGKTQLAVDLPFAYDPAYPNEIMAYDDGDNQTILLPTEGHQA